MFGSVALDVAVGLAFLYLVLGAIASHINELVAALFGWRARNLEDGIRTLLQGVKVSGGPHDGEDLADALWNHGLVRLSAGKTGRDPSYLAARTFALALFDLLAPADGKSAEFDTLRTQIAALPQSSVKDALTTFMDHAEGRVTVARQQVEDWYNAAMDRVSGVYKRQVQLVMLAIALLTAVGLGFDSIAVAQALWQGPGLRAAVSGAAQSASQVSYEDAFATLSQFDLPLGWGSPPQTVNGWLTKIVGLAISTVAVSLGAPFWFALLKKIGAARLSGPAPDEKK